MSGRLSRGDELARDAQDEYSRAVWRTSSWCNAYGTCVEVAHLAGGDVGVRDGKVSGGPVLRFTSAEWRDFLAGIQAGEFNA
ncbi:MAG TPA: DUF397 domain-containing protein [Streptosporangiaceae bacterium]|nr:DUF397 domain-containing protein [Streptosporangiaceae bacterium]